MFAQRFRKWNAPFVALVLVATAAGPATAQRSISVVYGGGTTSERIAAFALERDSEALYLRANDVARLFKATQFWNPSSRKVVLGIGDNRFTLTVDTRVVVIDGDPIMIRSPIRYDSGFVMIPLEFVLDVAAPYSPSGFDWDPNSLTLYVEEIGYNVESVAFQTAGDRSTAVIDMSEQLVHHIDTSTPGLVRLKLYGGRIDPNKFVVRRQHGLFNGVRAEQTERDAYVYFDIQRATKRITVEREESPPRLLLVLEKGDLPDIPDPDFVRGGPIEVIDQLSKERRDISVQKIVIDPGHGGKDNGKVGRNGVLEKDVNLAIAQKAREVLERELGLEVVMTREDDRLLALTRRTEIANEAKGDLFISIHCNSWFSSETGGFEAYFLSPARTRMEAEVARAENVGIDGVPSDEMSDIRFIIWDLVQNEYVNESSRFAEMVQKSMNDRLGIRNRGVKQANFVVLQGARMPAVLIEAGFLSNAQEERMLSDPAFQQQVAEGIAEAVRRFKERHH